VIWWNHGSHEDAVELSDCRRLPSKGHTRGSWRNSSDGLPDEAKEHADSVVIGEAETTWPRFSMTFAEKAPAFLFFTGWIDPSRIPRPGVKSCPEKAIFS